MRAETSAAPWEAYAPDAERPWNLRWAGHLYRRAAFGARWGELTGAVAAGPAAAVEKLLRPPAADDLASFNRKYDAYEDAAGESDSANALRAWWIHRMIETPHPLLETMALFWHGYFATSNLRVKDAALMARQIRTLRAHALGSFEALLLAICRDPAMLVWLDATGSRTAAPNPNFARAFLRAFTVGDEESSERDVSEAARAFTGAYVRGKEYRFVASDHDAGEKEILGARGSWKDEDVVRIALRHPATARRVVRRLYRRFIAEDEPEGAAIDALAASFARDFDIGKLLERILRSNLFFSAAAYRRRIKGPVEFALGIIKAFEARVSTANLAADLASLGQDLCHPPTVNGWVGGTSWIDWASMVGRRNLAHALIGKSERYGDRLDPMAVAGRHGCSGDAAAAHILDLLLQGDLEESVREKVLREATGADPAQRLRALAAAACALPEFQLA